MVAGEGEVTRRERRLLVADHLVERMVALQVRPGRRFGIVDAEPCVVKRVELRDEAVLYVRKRRTAALQAEPEIRIAAANRLPPRQPIASRISSLTFDLIVFIMVESPFVIREPDFKSVFGGNLNADVIRAGISAIRRDVRFVDGKTLLFLDEIQDCPNARTAFKFLAEDGRMDVIASGSLLGIKYKSKKRRAENEPRSIPVGFERSVTMYSLSFEEFLWAKGYSDSDFDMLRGYFERREKVPEAINGRFLQLVREYIVVGGLPEVVREYLESNHFGIMQSLQEKILSDYIDDIHNYAEPVDMPKIERCYQAIPRILAKENRKFKWGEVDKLGAANRAEAVAIALRKHLLKV